MSKEEKIDLGNIRGQKGEQGNTGKGINDDGLELVTEQDTYNEYKITYTDGTYTTITIPHPAEVINEVNDGMDNPVTSNALYRSIYGGLYNHNIEDDGHDIGHHHNPNEIITGNNQTLANKISQIETNISNLQNRSIIHIVDTLPLGNIDLSAIYLVPSEDVDTDNNYEEYVWSDGEWEHLGQFNITLTDYVAKTDITNNIENDKNSTTKTTSPKAVDTYLKANYYSKEEFEDLIGELQEFIYS